MKKLFHVLVTTILIAIAGCNTAAVQTSNEKIATLRTEAEQRDIGEWRMMAKQGDAEAQWMLGIDHYFNSLSLDGGDIDEDKQAVHWWRKAAEQGHTDAQYSLGRAYNHGRGVDKDKREAVRWYRMAAEQGLAEAQLNLGVAYWTGEGVITDKREAYIWYSIAKANGNEMAADNLRENNWRDYLSQSEIRAAQKEAAQRMAAIENRK